MTGQISNQSFVSVKCDAGTTQTNLEPFQHKMIFLKCDLLFSKSYFTAIIIYIVQAVITQK